MQPSPTTKPMALLTMIFTYTVILHAALPVLAVYLKTQNDPGYLDTIQINIANMISTAPLGMMLYATGALLLIGALVLPKVLLRQAKAKLPASTPLPIEKVLVPYLVRISMLESLSVVGLVLAIVTQEPLTIAPFVLIGLGGTLMMPPHNDFLRRFADQAK